MTVKWKPGPWKRSEIDMDDVEFRHIAHGSPEYAQEIALREAVLRRPLGLAYDPAELAAESASFHLGCCCAGRLAACLVLKPLQEREVQMRQVAVDPDLQGRGIGRALVGYAEGVARERGFTRIVLHARRSAVPFYEKLSYAGRGDEFIEVGIPHREMMKDL